MAVYLGSNAVNMLGGQPSGGGGSGGNVWQDQDGYVHLDNEGGESAPVLTTKTITANGTYNASSDSADGYSSVTVNVSGGGGGLVYESGTWTPSEDVARPTINFANAHDEPPSFVEMVREESAVYNQNENYRFTYHDWWRLFGDAALTSTSTYYAEARYQYVTTTTSLSASGVVMPNSSDDATDTGYSYPRYWVNEAWFKPSSNSTTRYWKSGQSYKWIAVWAPTT